jgi:hypothetical protein
MSLTLRPSGLSSGIDKDRPDYIVCSGQWDIGRIYQTRGGSGNNLHIEYRWAPRDTAVMRAQAAELVSLKPELRSWQHTSGGGVTSGNPDDSNSVRTSSRPSGGGVS